VNWRRLVVELIEATGWTPRQIGTLTLYQVKMMTSKSEDFGGRMAMDPKQYKNFMAQQRRR
jgi:hypothetical protein